MFFDEDNGDVEEMAFFPAAENTDTNTERHAIEVKITTNRRAREPKLCENVGGRALGVRVRVWGEPVSE